MKTLSFVVGRSSPYRYKIHTLRMAMLYNEQLMIA